MAQLAVPSTLHRQMTVISWQQEVQERDYQQRELEAYIVKKKHRCPSYETPRFSLPLCKMRGKTNANSMQEVAVLSSTGCQRFSPVRGMSRKKSSPRGRSSTSREHKTQLGEEVGGRHLRQQREHTAEWERTLMREHPYTYLKGFCLVLRSSQTDVY